MLYDNALLATAYLEAAAVTGEERYAGVAGDTLDFLMPRHAPARGRLRVGARRRHRRRGGHHVRLDAGPVVEALGEDDARVAAAQYGVTGHGNFEGGATVLRAQGAPPDRPRTGSGRGWLERALRRPQPGRDDKAIASWNGLALAALAQGGWRLGRPDLLDAARECARFLLGPMTGEDGRLRRTYRAGSARIPAYLDDHAAVCHGLLELALATGEPEWLPPGRGSWRTGARAVRRPGARRVLLSPPTTPSGWWPGTRSSTTTPSHPATPCSATA